jgi:ribosomal protein L11 methyltransferase
VIRCGADERQADDAGGRPALSRVFGDGGHPTTALARDALRQVLARRRCERVLDAGCGSGVLAAAAIEAGAAQVVAVDRDPEAVHLARRRVPGAEVIPGDLGALLPALGRFDLILANLPDDQLARLLPALAAALSPGGELVATGARLWRGRSLAGAASRLGLRVTPPSARDGWLLLSAKLPE